MAKPELTEADLRRAHRTMRIATPFEAMSDLVRRALAAAAGAMAVRDRQRAARRPVDMKRRAGGDFED